MFVRYPRCSRRTERRSTAVRRAASTSAMGAAQSIPVTPPSRAQMSTAGTKKITSRARESRVDWTGLPMACRKMLPDFCTQVRTMPPRKMRTQRWA